MGVGDEIVDLVSSGTTLKENDLKEIKGGIVLKSQVSYLGPCQASDFVISRMLLKKGLRVTAFLTQLILHFVFITSCHATFFRLFLLQVEKH